MRAEPPIVRAEPPTKRAEPMTIHKASDGERRGRRVHTGRAPHGSRSFPVDVYFATRTGQIDGFARDGRELFDDPTGSKFDGYPALAADGTLLVGDDSGTLIALG